MKLSSQGSNQAGFYTFKAEEHNLLQIATSNREETPIGSLFNCLPLLQLPFGESCYWRSTGSYILECVLSAWSVRQADAITLKERLPDLVAQSVQGLAHRVKYNSARLSIRDVFAANLLGWVVYSTCSQGAEAHIHFNGSMGMLTFVMEKDGSKRNPQLATFGPFLIDCANAWATRNGGIPQRLTIFQQRVKYFDELFGNDNSGLWYSGTLEAANATLGNLMEITLRVICEIIFPFSTWIDRIKQVVHLADSIAGNFRIATPFIHARNRRLNQMV